MKYFRLKILVCLVALALITAILLSSSLKVDGDHQNHPPYYLTEVDSPSKDLAEILAQAEVSEVEESSRDLEDKPSDQGLIIAINVAVVLIIITGTFIYLRRRKLM